MNKGATKRVDLRFNEIREAVVEISQAIKNTLLKDQALSS